MMNNKLILTAAVLAFCPILHAEVPPAAPAASAVPSVTALVSAPVTLRYKFAAGQVRRYSYDMDTNINMLTGQSGASIPIIMTMQMTTIQTVKSVRPADGAATLSTKIESMHMLQNGKEVALPADAQAKLSQPFIQVMLPTGKILSMEIPGMASMNAPGMELSKIMLTGTPLLPNGPVKIGDQWTGAVEAAVAGAQSYFAATLTGVDHKNGATLATIESKTTGTIDKSLSAGMPATMKMSGTVSGTGIQIFDATAGTVQSATGTADTDMTMSFGKSANGAPAPAGMPSEVKTQMQMKFTMVRIADTAPPAR